jgi:glycosyltransferase involved in cell wall biosynthesis
LAARRGSDALLVRTFHLSRAIRGDFIHRAFYAKTDGFFAVSDTIRRRCIQTAGISDDRVWTLRGTVDPDFFLPGTGDPSAGVVLGLNGDVAVDAQSAKSNVTETAGPPVVGTIARLVPNRGHFFLLEAFVKIRAELPGARLLITGRGEHRDAIVRRAKDLGLGREVLLSGFWDGDLRDILRQIHVFVIQSAGSEGTGRALLEAMAYGLPCVVTACEGLDEIVEDGKSGIVVPPSNPQVMANAILRLLQDPQAAAAIGSSARDRAKREFRRDLQALRAAEIYRRLLSSQRQPMGV